MNTVFKNNTITNLIRPILLSYIHITQDLMFTSYIFVFYSPVTRRINQGTFNLVNQSTSSSQLYWIHHENSSQQLEDQMFFNEPYVLELMPATHMQGATAMMSVLQDTLSTDYEEFSRAYNAPYNFPLSHFGEALPSNHNLEDNRFTHPPYYPVR